MTVDSRSTGCLYLPADIVVMLVLNSTGKVVLNQNAAANRGTIVHVLNAQGGTQGGPNCRSTIRLVQWVVPGSQSPRGPDIQRNAGSAHPKGRFTEPRDLVDAGRGKGTSL